MLNARDELPIARDMWDSEKWLVRGSVKSLGTDCIEKEMRPEHFTILEDLLNRGEASAKAKPEQFRRYGSARKLYTFNIDNASDY